MFWFEKRNVIFEKNVTPAHLLINHQYIIQYILFIEVSIDYISLNILYSITGFKRTVLV